LRPSQSRRLYDALPGPKVLVPFTKAEGADMHGEPMARSLPEQRMFRLARRSPQHRWSTGPLRSSGLARLTGPNLSPGPNCHAIRNGVAPASRPPHGTPASPGGPGRSPAASPAVAVARSTTS